MKGLNPFMFLPSISLLNGLIAWWKMDEESGTRINANNPYSHNLADNNAIGFAAGKQGNAASFAGGGVNNWLQAPHHSSFVMADYPFTVAGWLYPLVGGDTTAAIIRKGTPGSLSGEWGMNRTSAGVVTFIVRTAANTTPSVATAGGTATNSAWHFIIGEHDPATDLISCELNRAAIGTAALSGGSYVGTNVLNLGGASGGTVEYKGLMDEFAVWRRLLTTEEKDQLYNAGAGMTYPLS